MSRGLATLLLAAFLLAGCGGSSGGLSGLEMVFADYLGDPTDDNKSVEVTCPSGKKALGGGFELGAGGLPVDVQFSEPIGQLGQAPTGWRADALETTSIDPAEEWSFGVYAVCADT